MAPYRKDQPTTTAPSDICRGPVSPALPLSYGPKDRRDSNPQPLDSAYAPKLEETEGFEPSWSWVGQQLPWLAGVRVPVPLHVTCGLSCHVPISLIVAGPTPATLAFHGCLYSERNRRTPSGALVQPRLPSAVDPVKHVISPCRTMNTPNITQTDFYLQLCHFVISSTCIRKHPILGRDCSTQPKWQRPKGSSLNPIEAAPCKRGCL